MRPDFHSFLMDKFCEDNPEILDDMLPDASAEWMSELDCEDWLVLGDLYKQKER